MTREELNTMANRLRMSVIIKCIELNYIESGRYAETPPREILAVMAKSIYDRVHICTRDIRAWFIEVAKAKAEEGRIPLVSLPDLEYARAKWSPSYVPTPRGAPQLPAQEDIALASLPMAVQLRDEMTRLKLTHQ